VVLVVATTVVKRFLSVIFIAQRLGGDDVEVAGGMFDLESRGGCIQRRGRTSR